MRNFLCLLFLLYISSSCQNLKIQNSDASSQEVSSDSIIYLKNSSFEKGKHGHSTLPRNWFHCKDQNSPPDLHSSHSNYFEVRSAAMDGDQFVGMVVRSDRTVENISQQLPRAFQKGTMYEMAFSLAQAKKLMSASRTERKVINFKTPIILQIWGGFNYCENNQLLYESTEINHQDWQTYKAKFIVDDNYEVITFKVDYSDKDNFPCNGHLLLDNISPIVRVSE